MSLLWLVVWVHRKLDLSWKGLFRNGRYIVGSGGDWVEGDFGEYKSLRCEGSNFRIEIRWVRVLQMVRRGCSRYKIL